MKTDCPICRGAGKYWVLHKDGRMKLPDLRAIECSICSGTGTIQTEPQKESKRLPNEVPLPFDEPVSVNGNYAPGTTIYVDSMKE